MTRIEWLHPGGALARAQSLTRSGVRRGLGSIIRLLVIATLVSSSALAEPSTKRPLSDEQLLALAPHAAQVVNVALFDPVMAASLIPEAWIDSLTTGALSLEAEVPARKSEPEPPHAWPIGGWRTPADMVSSIRGVEPRAVAALYRALRPRLAANCKRRASTYEACDRAIRASVSRLSAPSVSARASGETKTPMTETQRELARLSKPVVVALGQRLRGLDAALWGAKKPRISTQ